MAEHPFAVTRDRYDEAMALARRMAAERDERFEQLKTAEAERDRYAVALREIADLGRYSSRIDEAAPAQIAASALNHSESSPSDPRKEPHDA